MQFGFRYTVEHPDEAGCARGLKFVNMMEVLVLTTAPGQPNAKVKRARRTLDVIAEGGLVDLWRIRARLVAEYVEREARDRPQAAAGDAPAEEEQMPPLVPLSDVELDDAGELVSGMVAYAASDGPHAKQARKALRAAHRHVEAGNLGAGSAAFGANPSVRRSTPGAVGSLEGMHPQVDTAAEYAAGLAGAGAAGGARELLEVS